MKSLPVGEGNGNPLQYSCLKKPLDKGAGRATVQGVAESDTTEQLTQERRRYLLVQGCTSSLSRLLQEAGWGRRPLAGRMGPQPAPIPSGSRRAPVPATAGLGQIKDKGFYWKKKKKSACSAGNLGSIPGLGRSPGEGTGNPLQYSCLENPMDGGAWWATVQGGRRVGDG